MNTGASSERLEADMPELELDSTRCIHCGLCTRVCPLHVIKKSPDGDIYVSEKAISRCIECAHCMAVCPRGAISLNAVDPDSLQRIVPAELNPLQRDMLFKSRRSIRLFGEKPIPRPTLLAALEDAGYAPSGENNRQVEWILIEGKEKMHALGMRIANWLEHFEDAFKLVAQAYKAGSDPIFRHAPSLIVAVTDTDANSCIHDVSAAITYLELSLHSRGVGTCWCGYIYWAVTEGVDLGLPVPHGKHICGGLLFGPPLVHYHSIPPRTPLRLTEV